jgi:hypothetical protein
MSMNLKLKGKMNHLLLLDALIDDDDYGLNIELRTFTKNIKKGSHWGQLIFSFPF